MTLERIIVAVNLEVRKTSLWVRVGLLAALPYAKEIKGAVEQQLPLLQPYVPDNVYKFMGGAVVGFGMLLSVVKAYQTARLLVASGVRDDT